jgi:hypothetical protein
MDHYQLEEYINSFRDHQREEIYKQIIDSKLLRAAFESKEGKAILGNCVDLITNNVIQIVRYCSENSPQDATGHLYSLSQEINTAYKLMSEWAKTLIRGSQHTEKAEKIKPKER